MTLGKLDDLMHRNYLHWDNDVYTNSDQLLPVLRFYFLEPHDEKRQIKLEYYKNLSVSRTSFLSSEYLDAGLSDEELLSIIDTRMRSDKWFEMPECFTGEQLYSLPLIMGCLHITNWMGREGKHFNIESAGYGATYRGATGCSVSTETVFDVCTSTEQLEVGAWYEFFFENDSANKTRWQGFTHKYTNKMSLVLTGALANWSFGISAYNSRSDSQLRDSYEVRYAPDGNGFLFRVRQKEMERVWFKAAWLKSEGLDANLCQQALRHWLE
ncbi:MAG: hypothetical protein LUE22_08215 [Oscillospiraceae bacterium]|nr:hypothetical protein [Oscillospiraceae bacterium]